MPTLSKSVIDVPILSGLQQKIDPRKLPLGSAAQALNLLADKSGQLVKRLGYSPLTSADPTDTAPAFTNGVSLGTWNDNLLIVGRGTTAGITTSLLKSYSDDVGGPICRGPVPDVKVTTDTIVSNTPNTAMNLVTAAVGDYQVLAWINTGGQALLPSSYQGQLQWMAIERSTGNLISAPQGVNNSVDTSSVVTLRMVSVGSTFIICYAYASNADHIGCVTMTSAALSTGTGWSPHGDLVTTNCAGPGGNGTQFDMRAAGGDTANFLLAWQVNTGTVRSPVASAIKCEQRPIASPGTVTATFVAAASPTTFASNLGIRADKTLSQRLIVAYTQFSSVLSHWTMNAASGLYPSMANSKATSVIYTSATPSGNDYEFYPSFIDVTFGGSGGTTGGSPTWTISHSPFCAAWNSLPAGSVGIITQSFPSPTPTASPPPWIIPSVPVLPAQNDARIIQNEIMEGATNVVGYPNTSGANAYVTRGLTLASRGLEANGIAYFLGWVPSFTQGSFVILAQDGAQNPTGPVVGGVSTAPSTPMRPVGVLQTRTALASPGLGQDSGNSIPSPNQWTGGSEWTATGDAYGTACVAYVGSSQGQRLQPAYGLVQTAPTTGYPMVQWGSMTAIGGALPCVFDGQLAFEQGFVYVPESLFVSMSNVTGGTTQGPTWNVNTDFYSWIFTWEQFDAQGNYHISARSAPLTISGDMVIAALGATLPYQSNANAPITFYVPTLGATMRQWPNTTFGMAYTLPAAPMANVRLSVWRTNVNGEVYYRLQDRYFNSADPSFNAYPTNLFNATSVSYADSVNDEQLVDGTHPVLYGDGSTGQPGNLDQFNPPATNIMVRHKERLFTAAVSGNIVRYSKALSEFVGPGYDDQVKLLAVGGNDPVISMVSMDDKLLILKAHDLYYVDGDGPADDGSGALFANPQPIPTDVGCNMPQSVISAPDGVYFMSTAGLRLCSRSLGISYAGGPIEDELATFPYVLGAVFYPQNNRVLFLASSLDYPTAGQVSGELLTRDYVLDAWTTAQLNDNTVVKGFVSGAVATALGGGSLFVPSYRKLTLHLLGADGTVWRENFPSSPKAYYDNATYVSSVLTLPVITLPGDTNHAASMQGRFRLWDILAFINSVDPHGLIVSVAQDYGGFNANRTWVWNSTTGAPSIAPGGVTPTPLTQLRTYHGLMGEAFQIQLQDVLDPSSDTGQGAQFLGLTCSIGVYPGPVKLPTTSTQ